MTFPELDNEPLFSVSNWTRRFYDLNEFWERDPPICRKQHGILTYQKLNEELQTFLKLHKKILRFARNLARGLSNLPETCQGDTLTCQTYDEETPTSLKLDKGLQLGWNSTNRLFGMPETQQGHSHLPCQKLRFVWNLTRWLSRLSETQQGVFLICFKLE